MWLLEPLHVGRGAQPTAPAAGALPETGRYRATFQKSKSYRLLVLHNKLWRDGQSDGWFGVERFTRPSEKIRGLLFSILIQNAYQECFGNVSA
jgi:hypothetical protein